MSNPDKPVTAEELEQAYLTVGTTRAMRVVFDKTITALRTAEHRIAELEARLEASERDARRYRWLRDSKDCSLSLTHNDHHTVYQTAGSQMDSPPDYYSDVSAHDRATMIQEDSIWTLHVYPSTPVGFYVWHGATLDAAIDAAIKQEQETPHDQ